MLSIFNNITKQVINDSKNRNVTEDIVNAWKQLFEIVKPELVKYKLYNMPVKNDNINVLLTMTTCKRFNLFTQTVNSIINTWTDISLVDKIIVVDDNSSNTDRHSMVELYPFINYYMKNEEEKGHRKSMNIIYDFIVKFNASYWIHVEDDFLFFVNMPYVTTGIKGITLLNNFNVKQIMFNRNYAETIDQINMPGNVTYTDNNYSLHDYRPNGIYSQYWPNFSFRPSIIDANAIRQLGNFDSINTFFELDYANKWTAKGFKTGFYNTITNVHIGRICNTQGDNAYSLNNTQQFNGSRKTIAVPGIDIKIKVINMRNRIDRMNKITDILDKEGLLFERIEAVSGKDLLMTPDLLKLFKDNDFGYKRGVIGCALSHYYLWRRLASDPDSNTNSSSPYYIIIEDDVYFTEDVRSKFNELIQHIDDYGLIFAGYHMTSDNKKRNPLYFEKPVSLAIKPINTDIYIGGTHCYIISKKAAAALVSYVETNGIKHGIDYMMCKIQNVTKVYELVPFIAFADWVETINAKVDSDIQYDNNALSIYVSDKYIFLQGLDQMGFDCYHENSASKYNYEKIAESVPDCVAFNTLGYYKSKITTLTASPYFSNSDGIYVNRDYYFSIFKKNE
jgi:GR25 family glycosyltransferase involved in LPS biosynthesis